MDNPSILIKDMPGGERPRERLQRAGAQSLRNSELLAILLRTGSKGRSALFLAEQLLQRFPTLDALARATLDELQQTKGIGPDKAIAVKSAFTLAQRLSKEMRDEAPLFDTPEQVADWLREENRLYEVEHLQVALLNTRRRLIRVEKISQGILDTLLVHPREVFRQAILANASAIIIVHNHPSGDPSPSPADIRMTRELIRAGQLLKIEVLDHIILGHKTPEREKDYVSLREMGIFA